MKGADQCPRCGSRKWADTPQPVTEFYAPVIRVCGNCSTGWEPFEVSDLADPKAPLDAFKEPCGNCAFRPRSHEQKDGERWRNLMDNLNNDPLGEVAFYCHKGVPIDIHEGGHGFAYPKGADGKEDPAKLRLCRGFLNMRRTQFQKGIKRIHDRLKEPTA